MAEVGRNKDVEESWDGKEEVLAKVQQLAWANCGLKREEGDNGYRAAHQWVHIKLPKTKQRSSKKIYVIALGGNLPWCTGRAYPTWADCHWHLNGAKSIKYMRFNSNTEMVHWFQEVTGSTKEPIYLPEGEDPFAPAHIWEAKLAAEERAQAAKKSRPDLVDLTPDKDDNNPPPRPWPC